MSAWAEAVLLSAVAAYLAFTVAETTLFGPLRSWGADRNRWLGKLLACGYCLGSWFALALVALLRPRLFTVWWLLDYALTAVVVAWLAAFQWAALSYLMARTGK